MKHKNNQIWRRFLGVEVLGERERWVMIWAEGTEQGVLFPDWQTVPNKTLLWGWGGAQGLVFRRDPGSLEKKLRGGKKEVLCERLRMRWLICGSDKGRKISKLTDELVLAIFYFMMFSWGWMFVFFYTGSTEYVFVCALVLLLQHFALRLKSHMCCISLVLFVYADKYMNWCSYSATVSSLLMS